MKTPTIEELAKDIAQKALETEYKGKTIREWIDIVFFAALNTQEPKTIFLYDAKTESYIPLNFTRAQEAPDEEKTKAPKEKPERLTIREWQNLDPWECCGQDAYCNHTPFSPGGCRKGCIVPKIYAKLAKIEDEQERTAGMIINKNVIYSVDGFADGNPVYETAECPACGFNFEKYTSIWGEPFCPHCGQRLEWGINEGEGAKE